MEKSGLWPKMSREFQCLKRTVRLHYQNTKGLLPIPQQHQLQKTNYDHLPKICKNFRNQTNALANSRNDEIEIVHQLEQFFVHGQVIYDKQLLIISCSRTKLKTVTMVLSTITATIANSGV